MRYGNLDIVALKPVSCKPYRVQSIAFPLSGQWTLERSCFLTPGNDTCFTEDDDDGLIGICYCHTDLCNHAARPTTSAASIAIPLAIVAAAVAAAGT